MRTLLAVVSAVLFCGSPAFQDEIKKLIDDLKSSEIEKREAAQKKLLELGEKAEPALEAALKETTDLEVRGRLHKVLDVLKMKAVFKGFLKGREKRDGASKESDAAVRRALGWLARHQAKDGSWGAVDYTERCKKDGCKPNPGEETYTLAVTAMSVCAFLGAGHTPLSKEKEGDLVFGDVVKAGLEWIVKRQGGDGSFDHRTMKYMYGEAWATLAVVEAASMVKESPWQEPAQLAVGAIEAAQNPNSGWRYSSRCGDSDTSVTMNCLQALAVAKMGGFAVRDAAINGGRAWFDSVTDQAGKAGYTHKGTGKVFMPGKNENFDHHETLAMGAGFARALTGSKADDLAAVVDLAANDRPAWDENKRDYYYWYWGTLALFQVEGAKGDGWKKWNAAVEKALVDNQETGGCKDGSWGPGDRWSSEGGRIYATAMNALTLETPYRYGRVTK